MRRPLSIAVAILSVAWCFLLRQSDLRVVNPTVKNPVDWIERLPIDGSRYVLGARQMIERGDWIYTADAEHSVGMQVLCAALFRMAGGIHSKQPILWWNYGLWIFLSVFFAYCLWRVTRHPVASALLTLPLLFSTELFQHANMVQYELTVGVLCFSLAYLAWRSESPAGRMACGFLIAFLSIFRVHYALLLPLFALLFVRRSGYKTRPLLQLGIAFALLTVPWNAYYSWKRGQPFFSQTGFKPAAFSRNQAYASTGRLYPQHEVQELRGWKWVKQDPMAYARLLGWRLGYLSGEKTDQFSIESRWVALFDRAPENRTALRRALWMLALFFCFWALVLNPQLLPFLFPAIAVVLPLIFVNYSFRFFVPALPCFILLISCGLYSLAERFGARLRTRSLWQPTFLAAFFLMPAHAQSPDCLLPLAAFASSDADPVALTVSTYERLLDRLGGTLTPEALHELSASPFQLPERLAELDALRRHLQELKGMVTKREWETPEVMGALSEAIQRRAAKLSGARTALTTAMVAVARDTKLTTNERYQPLSLSPDSRWLVTAEIEVDHGSRQPIKVQVVNLETKVSVPSTSPAPPLRFSGRLRFSPEGKEVWFVLETGQHWAVPLQEGTLQWGQAYVRGKATTGFGIKPSHAEINSRFDFGPIRDGQKVVRHDTQNDVMHTILIPETRGTVWKPNLVGTVPGSEKLFVVKDGQGYGGKIETYDIDPQGQASNAETIASWNKANAVLHVNWAPNGNLRTVFGATFYEWTSPGTAKEVYRANGKNPTGRLGRPVGFYSHRDYAVTVFWDINSEAWAEFGDVKSGKPLGVIDLPPNTNEITFLPDGSAFAARGFRHIQVVGYQAHLSTPP